MKAKFHNAALLFTSVFIIEGIILISASESNGFGDHIEWHKWSNGVSLAKETGRPLMVVLHKSWCPACKSLKPKFMASDTIAKLSTSFVMVNAKEGEEPMDHVMLNIDGKYIPRVIFLDYEANVLPEIVNESGNPQYKYYHMEAQSIVKAMKKTLATVKYEPKPLDEL